MASQKSGFQFKDFVVTESFMVRKAKEAKGEYNFDIVPSGIIDHKGKTFQLTLVLSLGNENSSILLSLECIGFFTYTGKFEEIRSFFTVNAPAIMFPYVRSYVSGLTALSGIDTIILPTMNLLGLKDTLEENISEKSDKEEDE